MDTTKTTTTREHVLVTGAGGYIGSVLVPALLADGHSVIAVDRFFFGPAPAPAPGLEVVREDTRFLPPHLFKGVTRVIDLAAVSNDPTGAHYPDSTWAINHRARLRTARLAREAGVDHYMLPSSCSVYGFNPSCVDESSVPAPQTDYARANLAAERDILPLADTDFHVTVLRLATVFGLSPRMRFDLAINAMSRDGWKQQTVRLMRDGSQRRPFIHVRDVTEAFTRMLAMPSSVLNQHVINVGSEALNIALRDVAMTVSQHLSRTCGTTVSTTFYGSADSRSYEVRFDRLRQLLGWLPGTSVATGVEEIVDALENGRTSDGPETIRLDWYRHIEQSAAHDTDLVMHGSLLRHPDDARPTAGQEAPDTVSVLAGALR